MPQSTTITIRIPVELKERLIASMERDQRTMTNYVCIAIEDRMRKVDAKPPVIGPRREPRAA